MTKTLEAPEAALEIAPDPALNQDKFAALIALADKIEGAVAAQNKIRLAVLKVAMPGDFVQFGKADKAKVELGGPGAERVGALIGLSITNIHDEKNSWEDKHGLAYTWRYIGDVHVGGRTIEKVEGRASSRDRFFGFEHGAYKELSDVKESDIRTAARRCLLKEGVKLMLGLRGLPADPDFLTSIGLDPKKVKKVEFEDRGSATGEKTTVISKIKHVGQRKIKNDKIVYVIELESGQKPETFSESLAKEAKGFLNIGTLVEVVLVPTNYAPKLESLKAVTTSETEKGDGQEA